ncbi:MAG: radical SAM protein [Proteobacteria bacterium]|nr:radical SAM protein [Pseudomonadota bacterium]MBU1386344.1 radical SAM protein [Pseudomonadota bacterium]MBU1541370.1 radical SAM protein [Pseudomonadota bacterium]MBU2482505.1 radical SAM protein [Pseudomonadota bacterium]
MQYKHIFGPIPSRRLGVSLGIDLVTHKTCSLDCLYCECGKTTRLTRKRKEYVKTEDVTAELEHYFDHHPLPDYVTFSGSGEPTLNTGLGQVIDYIKQKSPSVKVAVLTNSTLFDDPQVRKELLKADLVVPSLDGATPEAFERINKPIKGMDVQDIIQGIIDFSKEYTGKIWLEVLILPGINDGDADLEVLKDVIKKIKPDTVQLNTLDRPGTCADIVPASKEQLEQIKIKLEYPSVQIIARVDETINARLNIQDLESAILETVHRRPCTKKDLLQIFKDKKAQLDECLAQLIETKQIIGKSRQRGVFYETVKSGQKDRMK